MYNNLNNQVKQLKVKTHKSKNVKLSKQKQLSKNLYCIRNYLQFHTKIKKFSLHLSRKRKNQRQLTIANGFEAKRRWPQLYTIKNFNLQEISKNKK